MDLFTSVGHDKFDDIAFVSQSNRFNDCIKLYNKNPKDVLGVVYQNGEYLDFDDIIIKDSEQIKISELTQEKIDNYTQHGFTVYFVSRTKGYSSLSVLSSPKIYVIEKALAPLLFGVKYVSSLWKEYQPDAEYDYWFVSFNTRGDGPYGHSSVENIEFIEISMFYGDDIENYYRIIDNSVILSVDQRFDSDGEVTGKDHTVYVFDKRNGAYETQCYETGKIKTKISNGKYDTYDSVINNYYEYDGKTKIGGIIGIACKLFDTISVSYIMQDNDYVYVSRSYLDKWDDNTYVIDDDYPYTTIIKRENSKSSFEIETINESDEEDE